MLTISLRLSTRSSRCTPLIFELAVNEVIAETFVKTYNTHLDHPCRTGKNIEAFDLRNIVAFTQKICNDTISVGVAAGGPGGRDRPEDERNHSP